MTERELLKTLSANIKFQRGRNKWSQADLAEKLEISINFLSDIETGKKWPSPVTLVKMSSVFAVEAYELLKPEDILPDNIDALIDKYTDDVHKAVDAVRETVKLKLEQKMIKALNTAFAEGPA